MNTSSTAMCARVEHAQWRSSPICHLQSVPAAGEAERISRRRSWQHSRVATSSFTAQQHWLPTAACQSSQYASTSEQPAAVLFPAGEAPTQPYNTSQAVPQDAKSANGAGINLEDAQGNQWPAPAGSQSQSVSKQQPAQEAHPQQLLHKQGRRQWQQQQKARERQSLGAYGTVAPTHSFGSRQSSSRGQQQQQHAASAAVSTSCRPWEAAAITRSITSASCVWDLQNILRDKGSQFNAVHASAMLLKARAFASQDPSFWPAQPERAHLNSRSAARRGARSQLAGRGGHSKRSIHSAAPALQSWYHDEGGGIEDWGMADPDDYIDSPSHSYGSPPRVQGYERAVRLAQLSRVIHKTASIAGRLAAAGQMDVVCKSIVLTALAKVGYRKLMTLDRWLQEGSGKAAARLQRRYTQVMDQLLATPHPSVQCFGVGDANSRALTNMICAVAMEGYQPTAIWMQTWQEAMGKQLHSCQVHELCACMYALGKLKYNPGKEFMAVICRCVVEQVSEAKPCDIAKFVHGLAGVQHLPSDTWVATFLEASAQRLRYFQLSYLHRMLAAFASLGIQPDQPWLAAFYTRCQSILGGDMPQSSTVSTSLLGSMTALLAQLNVRPDKQWMEVCLLHARQGFIQAAPADLTQLLGALSQLRYRPGDIWMQAYLTRAFQLLGVFTPDQVVSLISCLSDLSYQPPIIWQEELMRKAQARLQEYSADQLAALLTGLARLRCQPHTGWLVAWERASQSQMDQFSAGALAATLWAFAELQHQPAVSWLYGYVLAAYSKLDSFDAGQLAAVFEALPRMSHPGWLDELVQICANESIPGGGRLLSSGSYDELENTAADPAASTSSSQAQQAPQKAETPLLRNMLPFRAVTSNANGGSGGKHADSTLRIYSLHNGMGQVHDMSMGGYFDEPSSNSSFVLQSSDSAVRPDLPGVHASWPIEGSSVDGVAVDVRQRAGTWDDSMSGVESTLAAVDLLIRDVGANADVAQVMLAPSQGTGVYSKPHPGQPGSSALAARSSSSSLASGRGHGMVQVALRSMRP